MLTDDQFARLVAEDVKNRVSAEQRDYLRLPDNWPRWKRALEYLLENLNDQLITLDERERREIDRLSALGGEGKRMLAEFQTDLADRVKKIERFRFYVETRLDECHRLIAIDSADPDERSRASDFYRNAIAEHRRLIREHDLEWTNIDEALWATLNGHWEFDGLVVDPSTD